MDLTQSTLAQRAQADETKALRRVLLLALNSPARHLIGGLELALADLAAQLRKRGCTVDMPLTAAPSGRAHAASENGRPNAVHVLQPPRSSGFLARFRRSRVGRYAAGHLPDVLKGYSQLFVDRHTAGEYDANLYALEKVLHEAERYDAVLLPTAYASPGMTALTSSMCGRTAVISLPELAIELKTRWLWPVLRFMWWVRLRGRVHPFLFRAVVAQTVGCAIFASEHWRKEALRHGLPERSAHTVYFGVPVFARTARKPPHGRLLWVGRMVAAKGLHLFVDALPAIRARIPAATLTAIAKRRDGAYAVSIEEKIAALGLRDAVRQPPEVERTALRSVYAEHDVLLCYSVFSEPVPLVLSEAYAAGLPVIISRPHAPSPLVREGETCLCFDPDAPDTLLAAVERLHSDGALRERLIANARKLVETQFSSDAMGARYYALLQDLRCDSSPAEVFAEKLE